MGCVLSKKNINDIHPHIFKVMNVDDLGNRLSSGQLEITESDLILHQQGGRNKTTWPLRCLRRYGFDAEIFSFESGRRCQTGAGIYAFKCSRAEQLFNLLQSRIQLTHNSNEDIVSHDLPHSPPNGSCASQISPSPDSNYLVPRSDGCLSSNQPRIRNWINVVFGRATLNPLKGPPLPSEIYVNRNIGEDDPAVDKENCNGNIHPYVNVNVNRIKPPPPEIAKPAPNPEATKPYMNLDLNLIESIRPILKPVHLISPSEDVDPSKVYMNMVPGSSPTSVVSNDLITKPNDYMNLVMNESCSKIKPTPDVLNTKSTTITRKTNYIVLDLHNNNPPDPNPSPSSLSSNNPTFETKLSDTYATIDFDRTYALSHTVKPNSDNDKEGCRKTRHHSTVAVSDIHLLAFPPRGSSSLSD